jgi:hypothetical protein
MKNNRILQCNMLDYFNFVKFHCISLGFAFVKLGTKFLLFAIGKFCISLFLVILVNGDGERKNSQYRSYLLSHSSPHVFKYYTFMQELILKMLIKVILNFIIFSLK